MTQLKTINLLKFYYNSAIRSNIQKFLRTRLRTRKLLPYWIERQSERRDYLGLGDVLFCVCD
jgi:hypothetical protein